MVLLTEAGRLVSRDGKRSFEQTYLTGPDIYEFAGEQTKQHGSVTEGYVIDGEFGAVRHGGGCLYSFVDGHAKWLRPTALRLPSHGYGCFNILGPRWTLLLS